MTAPSHFDAVIQSLSRDQSLTRIKKLLLYLCSNRWENKSAQLDAVDLRYLVQEILKTAPAIEQLKARLNKVVKTINKPAEYALVANAIVDHLKPLYTQGQETTQVISSDNNYYTATTTQLEQDPQSIRIRKILFCACNGRWENDLNILSRYSLNSLVERLHTLTPSLEELRAVLFSIVKTLNRQSEYMVVANSVLEAFTPLYMPAADSTRILFIPDLGHSQPSTPVAPVPVAQSRSNQHNQQIDLTSSSEGSQDQVELPKEPPDLFDLRLEVMKYTSPLRAKALLFSMLYRSVDATNEGWSVVRSHDLDELLHTTLDTYTHYKDLEAALKNTAKTLNDSKPYLQSAGAVLRAVRSWYDYVESINHDSSHNTESKNAAGSKNAISPAQPSTSASSSTSHPPTAPVNLRPSKAKQPISTEGDRTLDLTPPSIHQNNTLPMPETPDSTPGSQAAEDTGFFGDFSEQP